MFFHPAHRLGRVLVVLDRVVDLLGRLLPAKPVGNISRVAESAGEMSFQDVPVQVGNFPAANGFDEIREVISTAVELSDFLAVLVMRAGFAVTVGDENITILAMADV